MTDQQRFQEREGVVRQYDYDDVVVFAADVGPVEEASVDVVDGTAMVVVDDRQYEFEIPAGDAQAFIKNGVVTVEVEQ